MKPFFSLPGLNIPMEKVKKFVIADQAGFKNDSLEVVLDNSSGDIELPEDETEVRPVFGYAPMTGADPYYNGITALPGGFYVDEVGFRGPPDEVSIRCHSIFMGGKFKSSKTRDWHETTLGKIAEKIAKESGMSSAVVDEKLKDVKVPHRDQTEQSDFAFLGKLAEENGGVLKVNDNRLMIVERDKEPTSTVTVLRQHIINYSGVSQKRSDYDGVKARYHDYTQGKEVVVISEGEGEGDDGDRYFDLKEQFKTEDEAIAAAKSKSSALKKEGETFSFTCVGDPRLKAEARVIIAGALPNVRSEWVVDKVTHTIDGSGYVSSCDCVTPESVATEKSKSAKAKKAANAGRASTPQPANVPTPTPSPIP